jgi:hypothetical protein
VNSLQLSGQPEVDQTIMNNHQLEHYQQQQVAQQEQVEQAQSEMLY